MLKPEQNIVCETCFYFMFSTIGYFLSEYGKKCGKCHYYPPVFYRGVDCYPIVNKQNFCGKYKPKESNCNASKMTITEYGDKRMNLLITGGTGSIGNALVENTYHKFNKIIIYSRDENKQAKMKVKYPEYPDNKMRYMIGDVCDLDRLVWALKDIDICIHAAAMKHIDICEYNPTESIRVNVQGSVNVAKACGLNGIKSAMFLSTDKACNPCSGYGAQKAVVEHMWNGFNNIYHDTQYNTCRYGNVYGSNGSFLNKWKENTGNEICVTDISMTRFFWTAASASEFIIDRIEDTIQYDDKGCIYVPTMKSFRMVDIAASYSNKLTISGIRCPEKIHECLINNVESKNTYFVEKSCGLGYYIIYPCSHEWSKNLTTRGDKVSLEEYTSKEGLCC